MIERLDFFYTHIRVFSGMRVTYFYVRGSMLTHFGKIFGVRGVGCRRPSKAVFVCCPVNPDLSQCQRRCSGDAQQRTLIDAGTRLIVARLVHETLAGSIFPDANDFPVRDIVCACWYTVSHHMLLEYIYFFLVRAVSFPM